MRTGRSDELRDTPWQAASLSLRPIGDPDPAPLRPFRWDIAHGAHLGSMLDGIQPPDLWYADEVTRCAGRVLALSGNGDLHFVGRSMDSMFDLLSGALGETSWSERLQVLPMSLYATPLEALSPAQTAQLRANLAASGRARPA